MAKNMKMKMEMETELELEREAASGCQIRRIARVR